MHEAQPNGDIPDVLALIRETNKRLSLGEISYELAAEIQNKLVGGEVRKSRKELGNEQGSSQPKKEHGKHGRIHMTNDLHMLRDDNISPPQDI